MIIYQAGNFIKTNTIFNIKIICRYSYLEVIDLKLATLCYIEKNDDVLLLHRNKKEDDIHKGKWIGVGGKFEKGESPEGCALREISEETGLSVSRLDLKGMITFPKFKDDEDWYVFIFTADYEYGDIIETVEGSLKWVHRNEVLNMPAWEGDLIFLDWVLNGERFFTGKFEYENSKLIKHSVIFYD